MPKRATASRVNRLEELKGLLRSRDRVTAAELAEEVGVGLRTIGRDLELLRAQGVPIDADRGRGGGLRLQPAWKLGRLHLSAEEAIDLLVSIAVAERMNSPLLLQQLPSIKRKIVATFTHDYQARIRDLRRRILIGSPASPAVLASLTRPARRPAGIAEAFFNMRCVSITYSDQAGIVTDREIEPHFLYLNMPVWYLLAWDRLRGAIRFFRVDRIRSVGSPGTTFRLRDPAPFLEQAEAGVGTL